MDNIPISCVYRTVVYRTIVLKGSLILSNDRIQLPDTGMEPQQVVSRSITRVSEHF